MDDVEQRIEQLAHSEDGVRREAARWLGLSGDRRAVDRLVLAVQDPSPEVSRAAIEALGLLGDDRAVVPLLNVLRVRENALRRAAEAALSGLGEHQAASRIHHGDLRAVRPLLQIIRDDQRLMSALPAARDGRRDGAPVASTLFAALTDGSASLPGVAAAEALRRIARRAPTLLLSVAVPLLDALAQFALDEGQWRTYRTASRAITEAMKVFRDLPLPAGTPSIPVAELPRPAVPGVPDVETLPVPVVDGGRASGARPPLFRTWLRRFRHDG